MNSHLQMVGVVAEAHRRLIDRMLLESSFEAVLQLLCDQATMRSGITNPKPTIKQRRYRAIGPTLTAALDAAVMGRI